MTKFLVNKINESGLIGEATDSRSVSHNLMLISQSYFDGFMVELENGNLPYAIQICVCGRYITYIEVSKDYKSWLMRFYDLRNDNDLALDAAKFIQENWYGSYYFNWFMQLFERLKDHYSNNYDAAELLLVENAGLLLN
jgi:hypothetical protein